MKTRFSYRAMAIAVLILGSVIFCACTRQTELRETEPVIEKVADYRVEAEDMEQAKEPKEPRVFYRLDSIQNRAELDSFEARYTEEQKKIIFALNRIDSWRLQPGGLVVVPDSLQNDFLMYAPFPPELPLFYSIPKAVLINQRVQAFALYEKGELVRWGPVSSGKESTPTPNGLHYGNYKAKRKVSTVNKDWLLPYYFNFMNFEGVGVHQYAMPGYPASHACVRLFDEDARFIYDWAEHWQLNENEQVVLRNGTPFMVFGEYDFTASGPWLKLPNDHKDNFLKPAELDTLKGYVEKYFSDPRNFPLEEEVKQVL